MILRKVSNLKPGDVVVTHEGNYSIVLREIKPLPPVANTYEVDFDGIKRILFADDYVEIVKL